MSTGEAENPVFRIGGVSFLRIPTDHPQQTADFYRDVFSWNVRDDPEEPAFEDGTGHVIGHFVRDAVSGEAGIRPYVSSNASTRRCRRSPWPAARSCRRRTRRATCGSPRFAILRETSSACGKRALVRRRRRRQGTAVRQSGE